MVLRINCRNLKFASVEKYNISQYKKICWGLETATYKNLSTLFDRGGHGYFRRGPWLPASPVPTPLYIVYNIVDNFEKKIYRSWNLFPHKYIIRHLIKLDVSLNITREIFFRQIVLF